MKWFSSSALALLAAGSARAFTFSEDSIVGGDAGDLPGQTQTSCGDENTFGALDTITGVLGAADTADMFEIYIAEEASFTAVSQTTGDPMLSLYTPDSTGVVIDDDSAPGTNAYDAMVLISSPSIDKYYIAIHRYVSQTSGPADRNGDCVFAGCVSGAPSTEVLVSIPSTPDASDISYTIALTGTVTCSAGLVPLPVSNLQATSGWDVVTLTWEYPTLEEGFKIKFGNWVVNVEGADTMTSQNEVTGKYSFAVDLSSVSYYLVSGTTYFFQVQVESHNVVGLFSAKSTVSSEYQTTSWCHNGVQDEDETGVDCGGEMCEICPPSCTDGIQNQDELLVDCGGSICDACPESCIDGIMNQDETGVDCGGTICSECLPSCDDGLLNQDETDIDCGGTICPVCPPLCDDGILNGSETKIDCGGKLCLACCFNGVFDEGEEQADCGGDCAFPCPTCSDGLLNQDEELIDCGGPNCIACPTCEDGILNQDEELIDCGGPNCIACPTCEDGILNQDEELIDCGGPNCIACPTCEDGILNQDEELIDCGGPNCITCPTCEDGILNQDEDLIDCGGPNCIACPSCEDGILNQLEEMVDCGGPCLACPTCCDGIQNQGELGVDCGGEHCGWCNDAMCETDDQCASGFCECITTQPARRRRRLNMVPIVEPVTVCMCAGMGCYESLAMP